MSPNNEVIDVLDEMKDSRVLMETIEPRQPKNFEIFVKNFLWKFSYDGRVEMTVECNAGTLGSYWSVLAEHEITIRIASPPVKSYSRLERTFFYSEKFSVNTINSDSWKNIEIKTTVKKVEGLSRFPRLDLENLSNDEHSSAVLLVEGKKLRVNKQYLSTHSPVFEAMFNSQFAEKDQNMIPIKKTTFISFIEFLRLLHFGHSFENSDFVVYDILKLGDFYQIQWIKDYCENRLVNLESKPRTTSINPHLVIEKFERADHYKLNSYQHAIIDSLSKKGLRDIVRNTDFTKLSKNTQLAVYRKLQTRLK